MRLATGGTIKATELALDPNNSYKMAINLSGGYHHAQPERGDGFCVYGDIQITCKLAWEKNPNLKILYVDLDAHQGNGVELTFAQEMAKDNPRFVAFDMYGENNYPGDNASVNIRNSIKYNYPLDVEGMKYPGTPQEKWIYKNDAIHDIQYLDILTTNLPKAIAEEGPDLIIYNAGTDPYEEDRLGHMQITEQAIIERDRFVFQQAHDYDIPLIMMLSGGYSKKSATIISNSITNIFQTIHNIQPIQRNNWWYFKSFLSSWMPTLAKLGVVVGISSAAYLKYSPTS